MHCISYTLTYGNCQVICTGAHKDTVQQHTARTLLTILDQRTIDISISVSFSPKSLEIVLDLQNLCFQHELPRPHYTFIDLTNNNPDHLYIVIIKIANKKVSAVANNPLIVQVRAVTRMMNCVMEFINYCRALLINQSSNFLSNQRREFLPQLLIPLSLPNQQQIDYYSLLNQTNNNNTRRNRFSGIRKAKHLKKCSNCSNLPKDN